MGLHYWDMNPSHGSMTKDLVCDAMFPVNVQQTAVVNPITLNDLAEVTCFCITTMKSYASTTVL